MAKRVKIYNQTHRVSKQLNKHGRLPIKKMDKKEREEARANCLHHAEKNGRVKSRTLDNMDNTCTCRICSARFGVNGATKDEYKKMTKPIVEQIDLLKWVCQSAGIVDQKTVDYYCKMQYMLLRFPKIATRTQKQFMKVRKAVKKKKNRGYTSKSGSQYGQWEER